MSSQAKTIYVIPGEDPGSTAQSCPLQTPVACSGSRLKAGMTKPKAGMTKPKAGMTKPRSG